MSCDSWGRVSQGEGTLRAKFWVIAEITWWLQERPLWLEPQSPGQRVDGSESLGVRGWVEGRTQADQIGHCIDFGFNVKYLESFVQRVNVRRLNCNITLDTALRKEGRQVRFN